MSDTLQPNAPPRPGLVRRLVHAFTHPSGLIRGPTIKAGKHWLLKGIISSILAALLLGIFMYVLESAGFTESRQVERGDIEDLRDVLVREIHAEKGVPLAVLEAILRAFGEDIDRLDPAEAERLLRAKADEFQALTARLRRLSGDDLDVQALRERAAEEIERGDFLTADGTLAEAEALDLAAIAEQEAATRQRRSRAAETRAGRGAVAALRFAYVEAAAHYAAAADLLPADADEERFTYRLSQANAVQQQGNEYGDNAALADAIDLYRRLLTTTPRTSYPNHWAATQNNLGTALQTLGEREAGTDRLEEAVAAFHAALREYTRERTPLNWAMTQTNLGNALRTLGEREAGTARLEEAVAAFRTALREYTRERMPLGWAMTQNNLGNALVRLDEREAGTDHLEEAIGAYRAALEERTQARVPLGWAMTQTNLGNALRTLGERETGTHHLEEAVAAFRTALREYTRERVPLNWAATQNNLGIALAILGKRRGEATDLDEAIACFKAALAMFESAGHVPYAEMARSNLAAAKAVRDRLRN